MGQIILRGRIPSKKNSTITMVRNGRVLHFPQNAYRTWHKDTSKQLIGCEKIKSDFLVLKFWFPDNRRTDLTNKTESVMDLLVDNGFIKDDCWQVIKSLTIESEGIDKKNPRVEILW